MTDNSFSRWVLPPQPLPGDPQERVGDSDFPPDYFQVETEEATSEKGVSSYHSDLRGHVLRNLTDFLDIRLKHQAGRHNQRRHGWRYGGGESGSYESRLGAARRSMHRTPEEGERLEYRKRAGMIASPPKLSTAPEKIAPAPAPKPKRVPKPKPAAPTVDIPYRPSMETQRAIYAEVDNYLKGMGVSRKDLSSTRVSLEVELKTIVDKSPLVIRAPGDAAEAIIADGRWKSQFESGESRGSYTPSGRASAEYRGLGVPTDIAHSKRPIYGYLKGATNEPGSTHAEASHYGEVIFNMKPSVRNHATFTMGDSLGNFGTGDQIGTPVVKPNLGSMSKGWMGSNITRGPSGKPAVERTSHSYFEAQIHGGVRLSDVASVTFTSQCFAYRSSTPSRKYLDLERILKTKGIEVIYAPNES